MIGIICEGTLQSIWCAVDLVVSETRASSTPTSVPCLFEWALNFTRIFRHHICALHAARCGWLSSFTKFVTLSEHGSVYKTKSSIILSGPVQNIERNVSQARSDLTFGLQMFLLERFYFLSSRSICTISTVTHAAVISDPRYFEIQLQKHDRTERLYISKKTMSWHQSSDKTMLCQHPLRRYQSDVLFIIHST